MQFGFVKKTLSIGFGLVLLTLVMAYLAGFFGRKIEPGTVTVERAPPAGEVIAVSAVDLPITEQAAGTLRARNEALISTRIIATIAAIPVRAGDSVNQGAVLAQLDSRDLEARVGQQRQAVAAAEARLASAQPNYNRVKSLTERGLVAKADLDRAEADLRAAQADVDRARRAVDEAATALSFAVIKAPFAGRVAGRFADPGDTATPGVPLLSLYDPAQLVLHANVRESLASELTVGQALTVRIDAINEEFPVRVDEIVPTADPGSRSFVVKAAVPARANLFPGLFGRLLIPRGTTQQVRIPRRAVARFGQLEFVQVMTAQGPVRRYIRTGGRTATDEVEVLSGLRQGEQIVLPAG